MTAPRHSARQRASTLATSSLGPLRPRRTPARLRLVALPACVVLASLLTGTPAAAGAPAPAPVPAPSATATTASATAATAAQPAWTWPVGPPRQLLRPFEAPASRYAAGHRGIDLVAAEGDSVRAPADGVVTFVGTVVDRPVVSIQHGNDLLSSFEPVAASVSEGDRVRAGQVIGSVATGAHCTARCVHFGVRRHGHYISPVLFLGGLTRAVLLPLPPAGPFPLPPR